MILKYGTRLCKLGTFLLFNTLLLFNTFLHHCYVTVFTHSVSMLPVKQRCCRFYLINTIRLRLLQSVFLFVVGWEVPYRIWYHIWYRVCTLECQAFYSRWGFGIHLPVWGGYPESTSPACFGGDTRSRTSTSLFRRDTSQPSERNSTFC